MIIEDYGFLPHLYPVGTDGTVARVTAVHKERYELICNQGECFARLKSGIYFNACKEEFPTTGDFVEILYNSAGDSQIIKTCPRKSFFARLNPAPGMGGQAVAANFDYVFILQSLNDDFNLKRLERYLTLAWQSGAVPVVVLTKADLLADCSAHLAAAEKTASGVSVFAVSVKTGQGMEALSHHVVQGKTIVLLGSSGVGKSSFVNALAGREVMDVQRIRQDDSKGRHTTTCRQLIRLDNGAMMIDTPGMRELGMWNAAEGLGESFSDVERYMGLCKFSDCRHETEPGCAIKAAIANGELSAKRWEGYLRLKLEAKFSKDKEGMKLEKRKRNKEIAKSRHQLPKADYKSTPCLENFTCKTCGSLVVPEGAGSQHRNHCPKCLSSVHVDNEPGDRASLCKGIMDPIGVWVRKNGEWAIIHRCRSCGVLASNRIAADDNPTLLMSIAVKPLAAPPFPLGQLEQGLNQN